MSSNHDTRAGRRRNKKIDGQFTALLVEMLDSPPWHVLNLSERRVLDRLFIEVALNGGFQTSKNHPEGLCVTFAQFEKFGIADRHAIAPAIRVLEALGFLKVVRKGRGGNAEFRRASVYLLLCINYRNGSPTHAWRQIKTIADAEAKASEARKPVQKAHTDLGGGNHTETAHATGVGNHTTRRDVGNHTTVYISGWGGRSGGRSVAATHDRAGVGPRPTPRPRVPLRTGTRPRVPLLEPEQQ